MRRRQSPPSYVDLELGTPGLISYLRFGDPPAATVAVDHATGLHFVYANSPVLAETGALTGDPDSAVKMTGLVAASAYAYRNGGILAQAAWTIAFWAKYGLTTTREYDIVFMQSGDIFDIAHSTGGGDANTLKFYDGTTWTAASELAAVDDWCRFAFAFDGTNLRVYKNGVLAYGPAARGRALTTADLFWGSQSSVNGYGGWLDEATIRSRAITAAEEAMLYNAGRGR